VVAAAPEMHLLLAEFFDRLDFVLTLKRAVVALVQPPVLHDRNPHLIELFEREPQRFYGAALQRREGEIEAHARFAHQLAAGARFLDAERRERAIAPTGEDILLVRLALAVANDDKIEVGGFRHDVLARVAWREDRQTRARLLPAS